MLSDSADREGALDLVPVSESQIDTYSTSNQNIFTLARERLVKPTVVKLSTQTCMTYGA